MCCTNSFLTAPPNCFRVEILKQGWEAANVAFWKFTLHFLDCFLVLLAQPCCPLGQQNRSCFTYYLVKNVLLESTYIYTICCSPNRWLSKRLATPLLSLALSMCFYLSLKPSVVPMGVCTGLCNSSVILQADECSNILYRVHLMNTLCSWV